MGTEIAFGTNDENSFLRVPLFMRLKQVVHPNIFNVNIQIRIQHIQTLQKNIVLLGGGGGVGVHGGRIEPMDYMLNGSFSNLGESGS